MKNPWNTVLALSAVGIALLIAIHIKLIIEISDESKMASMLRFSATVSQIEQIKFNAIGKAWDNDNRGLPKLAFVRGRYQLICKERFECGARNCTRIFPYSTRSNPRF